jgi:hypothetical protein
MKNWPESVWIRFETLILNAKYSKNAKVIYEIVRADNLLLSPQSVPGFEIKLLDGGVDWEIAREFAMFD